MTEVYAESVNALEQASMAKPKRLSSGDISRITRGCLSCGHCTKSTTTCTCTGLGIGSDITLTTLPPPAEGSTPNERIRRFCSIVAAMPQMDGNKMLSWYEDLGCRVKSLFASSANGLRKLMQVHLYTVSKDVHLEHEYAEYFRMAGYCQLLPEEQGFDQIPLVIYASCIALEVFLMGEWSCLTMIDCSLLLQFLEKASRFDLEGIKEEVQIKPGDFMTLHSVVKTIFMTLSRMRSIYGTRIALENKRGIRLPGTFVAPNSPSLRGLACFQAKESEDIPVFVPSSLDYEQMWVPSAAERDLVKEVAFHRYPKEKVAYKPRSIREDFPYTIVD